MGMDVDEARSDDPTFGIDHAGCGPGYARFHCDDLPVRYRHIGLEAGPATPVDHMSISHQKVKCHASHILSQAAKKIGD